MFEKEEGETELNDTLAEFEGRQSDWRMFRCFQPYTESLDALIPVIEKLGGGENGNTIYFELNGDGTWFVNIHAFKGKKIDENVWDKSPSLALATACASIIKKLKDSPNV